MAEELRHYGVLGMRWGRRKSPGQDASSSDHRSSSVLKKKKISDMSNEELRALTNRLNLERQYKELRRSEISAGRKFVTDLMLEVGKSMARAYITKAGTVGIDYVLKSIGGDKFTVNKLPDKD